MSDLYKIYLNSLAAAGRAFEADETPGATTRYNAAVVVIDADYRAALTAAGVVFRAGLRRPGFARIVWSLCRGTMTRPLKRE